jgi:Icc-related predicted phosphoesterase
MVRVVCISDTHTYHESVDLPQGDILVHAGDFTFRGREDEVRLFGEWLRRQSFKYKVIIAGNHDLSFERNEAQAKAWLRGDVDDPSLVYLKDKYAKLDINGRIVTVYGSPWQPEFCAWAFNLPRGAPLKAKWDRIPNDIDILVTHGPPANILDKCEHGERVGCKELYEAVKRVNPRIHVFGHIHEEYGTEVIADTTFINASICTVGYRPTNKPIVIEI